MPPASDIVRALVPVAESLDRLEVRYMIGGSVASSALGVARSTLDVDLVAEFRGPEVDAFVSDLTAEYYVDKDMILEAIRQSDSFNLIHLSTMLKVDIFVLKQTEYDRTALERARMVKLDEDPDQSFPMASPEDVILHKLVWFHAGGEVAKRQWRDVLGVLRVQADSLDWDYLDHWAEELGVSGLLMQARGADPDPGGRREQDQRNLPE